MKKRFFSILLAAVMVLSLIPATVFATGTFYAITNGTAQDANGTISIYNDTAAEGDTVTVEVHPADVYQLKTLTVAPTGFVDLGIKDAEGKPLYWKETNLGASQADDYGDYFAWGETAPYYEGTGGWPATPTWKSWKDSGYAWQSYCGQSSFVEWSTLPYDATSNILNPEFDAATAANSSWRTPTKDEFVALATNCVLEWTDNYNVTSNAGYIVYKAKNDTDKGKTNMNGTWKKWNGSSYATDSDPTETYSISDDIHIFLPAAGYGNDTELVSKNTAGAYCSSDLNNTNNHFVGAVNFNKSAFNIAYNYLRSYGFSIRPVISGITPEKQDDGTYQFTMPGYAVTVTAEFAVTIADILPSNFPASDKDNSWCNSEKDNNVYIYKTDSNLVFNNSTEDCYSVPLSSPLTKEVNPKVSYVYSKDETEIRFNMTGDNYDKLENIVVNKCTIPTCIGTYAAPEAFSVTYNANGATSGTAPANQTKTSGVDLTLAANTGNLAKTDYTFTGWNTKADGSGKHYDAGANYSTDADVSLYAEWAPITIADILPEDFPDQHEAVPSNAWVNDKGITLALTENMLSLTSEKDGDVVLASDTTTAELTKTGDNYSYSKDGVTTVFVIDSNDKLVSVQVNGLAGDFEEFNGTYTAPHVHSFSYAADNNKLIATCADSDSKCDLTNKKVNLTLTAVNAAYDGAPYDGVATDDETSKFSETTGKTVSIEYWTTGDGAAKLDSSPTDAGSYEARITVTYGEGQTAAAVAQFAILKRFIVEKAGDATKEFDEMPLTCPDHEEVESEELKYAKAAYGEELGPTAIGFVDGEGFNVVPMTEESRITEAGEVDNVICAMDVTLKSGTNAGNYEFRYMNGKLKVTAAMNTIANVLATVEGGFPTSVETGWINESNYLVYLNESKLQAQGTYVMDSTEVSKYNDTDNYTCNGDGITYIFNMNNGVLQSINLTAAGITDPILGTYSPYVTVTYDMQGHGTQVQAQTITRGALTTQPTKPTAQGWEFAAWYPSAACTQGEEYAFAYAPVNENITLYAKWVEAAPQPPVYSGGESSSTVTVPVTGDKDGVKVSATVSGSTAMVKEIKDADLAKVTDGESVSIDLSAAGKNIDTAKIPTETVEKIAEKSSMTVKLPIATVEFDKAATEEIADQAKGSNIELVVNDVKEVSLNAIQKESVKKLDTAIIIDAHLASNGSRLCTADNGGFGGGSAKVILPYEIKNNRKPENYSVFYVNEAGKLEKLNASYDVELKAFVFEIEHFSVYAVAFEQFVDIDANAYYYDAVKWAIENGITDGVDATHFNPSGITNRAQMVTFLWRAAGCPEPTLTACPFADVESGSYYDKAVLWAYENGITGGTSATTFDPNSNVNRAQVVTFLWRYSGGLSVDYWMQMSDVASGEYYSEAVRWALAEKITDGTSKTTFSPEDDCLRGQAVTFLYRGFGE